MGDGDGGGAVVVTDKSGAASAASVHAGNEPKRGPGPVSDTNLGPRRAAQFFAASWLNSVSANRRPTTSVPAASKWALLANVATSVST